jgi:hypothetical protein
VASSPNLWPHPSSGAIAPVNGNSLSVVIPAEGFTNVVRLVTAGFVSQLAFGFEAIDDLQLAIELLLRSVPVHGTHATVAFASGAEGLTLTVGPFEENSIEPRLQEVVQDGLDLRSYLGRLADTVEIVEAGSPAVVLRKRLEVAAV